MPIRQLLNKPLPSWLFNFKYVPSTQLYVLHIKSTRIQLRLWNVCHALWYYNKTTSKENYCALYKCTGNQPSLLVMCPQRICSSTIPREYWMIFREQAYLRSYVLAPRPPSPSSPASKLSLFLSLPVHRRSSFLTRAKRREWHDSKKAWPTINHSLLSDYTVPVPRHMSECPPGRGRRSAPPGSRSFGSSPPCSALRNQTACIREYWMIFRPGFLGVVWFVSTSFPHLTSVSWTGDTQDDWERETPCWRSGGAVHGAKSYDIEKPDPH